MILKKNFNPITVIHYMYSEILFSIGVSSGVYVLFHLLNWNIIRLPFSVAAILGSALAIFIAFRNQSAYARWWEARTMWGGIVNSSRVFARLIRTFVDSHRFQSTYNAERSEVFKSTAIRLQIAWAHALRLQLRQQQDDESVRSFLTEDQYTNYQAADNKVNFIQLLIGERIYDAMGTGVLGGFDSFQLEGQLLALTNYQGSCERIKVTPMLRQYHYFTKLFLFVFMLVLPMSLMNDFDTMHHPILVIPVSVMISFVFGTMAKVGEVNEDPFEGKLTDVPLTAICNTIERDLLEIAGSQDQPTRIVPQNGYLH